VIVLNRARGRQAATFSLRGLSGAHATPYLTDTSHEPGFALCEQIGWPVIMRRARQALAGLPPETVLAGLSMGASVAAALLGERPETAGVLLLHNTGGGGAETVRPGFRLQLHIADPDVYQPAAEVAAWEQGMTDL
jgi:pimeloyl-ACP methyl ester carboxylesterase